MSEREKKRQTDSERVNVRVIERINSHTRMPENANSGSSMLEVKKRFTNKRLINRVGEIV